MRSHEVAVHNTHPSWKKKITLLTLFCQFHIHTNESERVGSHGVTVTHHTSFSCIVIYTSKIESFINRTGRAFSKKNKKHKKQNKTKQEEKTTKRWKKDIRLNNYNKKI